MFPFFYYAPFEFGPRTISAARKAAAWTGLVVITGIISGSLLEAYLSNDSEDSEQETSQTAIPVATVMTPASQESDSHFEGYVLSVLGGIALGTSVYCGSRMYRDARANGGHVPSSQPGREQAKLSPDEEREFTSVTEDMAKDWDHELRMFRPDDE